MFCLQSNLIITNDSAVWRRVSFYGLNCETSNVRCSLCETSVPINILIIIKYNYISAVNINIKSISFVNVWVAHVYYKLQWISFYNVYIF